MRIKTLVKETKFLKRFYYIRYRYQGDSVGAAAEKVVVYKMVVYHWQDRWNKGGYDGIVPRFASVKPAKLSPVKMARLRSILEERDDYTTNEVQKLIRTILRKLGMKYAKLYQHDYRRPKNVEDILKDTIMRLYAIALRLIAVSYDLFLVYHIFSVFKISSSIENVLSISHLSE